MTDFDNEFPDEHSHQPQRQGEGLYALHVTDDEGRHYLLNINLTAEGIILDLYDRYGEQNLATWAKMWDEVGQMVYDEDPINQQVVPQTSNPLFDEVMSVLIARGTLTTEEAGRLSRDQHIIDRFWASDIGPMVDSIEDQISEEITTDYQVTLTSRFRARSMEEAVAQAAAWLEGSSYTAGYRVRDDDGNSMFIDAEMIDYDKFSMEDYE